MNEPAGAEKSVCLSPRCGEVFDGLAKVCPNCGFRALTQRNIRLRGWVVIGCGVLLLGIMIPVSISTVPLMLDPGADVDGARYTGSETAAEATIALFATIITFAFAAIASGTWQVRYGRQNWPLVIGMVVVAAVLFVGAKLFLLAHAV